MKVDERRERLVAAAFEVIARDGVAGATTRAVCAQADMPQGAFHYAFRSKDELLRELSRAVLAEQTADLFDVDDAPETFEETVHLILRRIFEVGAQNVDRQRVLTDLMVLDLAEGDDPGAMNRWQFQQYTELAERLLNHLADRFAITWTVPVPALARMVATAMSGNAMAWLGDRDEKVALGALDVLGAAIIGFGQR